MMEYELRFREVSALKGRIYEEKVVNADRIPNVGENLMMEHWWGDKVRQKELGRAGPKIGEDVYEIVAR